MRIDPRLLEDQVDPLGYVWHKQMERTRVHVLGPASLDEALETIERPEDCNKPCWRHVDGGGQCECDDETEGGTWQPGC